MKSVMRIALPVLALWSSLSFGQTVDDYVAKVRKVQDSVETAYVSTKAMGPEAVQGVLAATNDAMLLFREVAETPITKSFSEEDKGRIYEELLRGRQSDKKDEDTYGSLVRLFWMTMTHHGVDPKTTFDGKVTPYGSFFKAFLEVFNDVRSIGIRKKVGGGFVWGPLERANREGATRAMIVRLFDINEALNKMEKNDSLFDYVGKQLNTTAETGMDLRRERLSAEKIAMAFYVAGLASNLVQPSILPLIYSDPVGYFTNYAWGSPIVSGAVFLTGYTVALGYKYFTSTSKTYAMMSDLVRVMGDPVESAKAIKKGKELTDDEETKAKGDYKEFVESIRRGEGVLGKHRAKMMKKGYDPLNPVAGLTCEAAMGQAFL